MKKPSKNCDHKKHNICQVVSRNEEVLEIKAVIKYLRQLAAKLEGSFEPNKKRDEKNQGIFLLLLNSW